MDTHYKYLNGTIEKKLNNEHLWMVGMNGPLRTACFAKGMHNIPEVRNGSRTGSQNRKLSDKTRTNERTDGECSILRFAPALNEPLRNNYQLLCGLHNMKGRRRCLIMLIEV